MKTPDKDCLTCIGSGTITITEWGESTEHPCPRCQYEPSKQRGDWYMVIRGRGKGVPIIYERGNPRDSIAVFHESYMDHAERLWRAVRTCELWNMNIIRLCSDDIVDYPHFEGTVMMVVSEDECAMGEECRAVS